MAKPFLSIVIPTCNDAEHLPLTLIEADRIFSAEPFSYEIIVVDDGSRDLTSESAKRIGGSLKNVKVIDNTEQRGLGTATQIGMLAAKGAWRIAVAKPADISFPWFAEKLGSIQPGSNIHLFSVEEKTSLMARFARALHSLFIRYLFRSRLRIFSPLAVCFSDEAAGKIFSIAKAEHAGLLEALLISERLGYRPIEAAIDSVLPAFSAKNSHLQTLLETIKIRWWLWRNHYKIYT